MFGLWKKYNQLKQENQELREKVEDLNWRIQGFQKKEELTEEAKFCLDVLDGKRDRLLEGLLAKTEELKEYHMKKTTDEFMKQEMEKLIHSNLKEKTQDV